MIAIIVSCCATCPFVMDGIDKEPWLCDAHGFEHDGPPRQLPEQRVTAGQWPPPPDWCPLREADRLVTLRLKP